MAGALYLIDTNVLLRWVQPNSPDYPFVTSAVNSLVRRVGNSLLRVAESCRVLERLHSSGRPEWFRAVDGRNGSTRKDIGISPSFVAGRPRGP